MQVAQHSPNIFIYLNLIFLFTIAIIFSIPYTTLNISS